MSDDTGGRRGAGRGRGARNRAGNGGRGTEMRTDAKGERGGGRGRRVRGRGRGDRSRRPQSVSASNGDAAALGGGGVTSKILVLHGNRQTGELLLGRMSSLQRKLLKPRAVSDDGDSGFSFRPFELVAPDAPFLWEPADGNPEDRDTNNHVDETNLRTWWHRNGNEYRGLKETLDLLHATWSTGGFEGIMGFSQGARLAHLIGLLHSGSDGVLFPGLKSVILASGYGDVPLPTNFPPSGSPWEDALPRAKGTFDEVRVATPSLHIMGKVDQLVPMQSSQALLPSYLQPTVHEHNGGHHVPTRADDVRLYLDFIDTSSAAKKASHPSAVVSQQPNAAPASHVKPIIPDVNNDDRERSDVASTTPVTKEVAEPLLRDPDEEHAQSQIEEFESLSLIFPDEVQLLSKAKEGGRTDDFGEDQKEYIHPIAYTIDLRPQDADEALWPSGNVALHVQYTPNYPDDLPNFSLKHDMNLLQFKGSQHRACMKAVQTTAEAEAGMPCVMSCAYAAREFFEEGGLASSASDAAEPSDPDQDAPIETSSVQKLESTESSGLLARSTPERVHECNQQGLDIATSILGHPHAEQEVPSWAKQDVSGSDMEPSVGKGGAWKYTIGLVGKPSAGKSTFFNAASAFARQRGGADSDGSFVGGATMAPHPFTTIDPNVGYCLVPAPNGACPEDDLDGNVAIAIGSTHGRDSLNRRLLPVMLKDVAGLVPGAYQGRGKGNKFLDDLTDADVLIHVVDASGTADAEGNTIIGMDDKEAGATTNPLTDLAWVRNELVEWVYFNLSAKWDGIRRKGRDKLIGMFSGYKQSQAFVVDVLLSVEQYLEHRQGRSHAFDDLSSWDEGDLHRLVSSFLGARFPMALALNKSDLPSASTYVEEVQDALPSHGAHIGVPLSARREMSYVRHRVTGKASGNESERNEAVPNGVWDCLRAAMQLREPVVVFPVNDMGTYEPLPGMTNYATGDSSLPNTGMISCLEACGGSAPSLWDDQRHLYSPESTEQPAALRDALLMKPGSTVEDVFSTLKKMGALSGEFVRAEGAEHIGEKPKLVKKDDRIGHHNRVIHVMTNRRR